MTNHDLIFRVQRLYAAIGAVEETEISNFMPKLINDGHRIGFYQDWSGGLSHAELTNYANSLISNIAGLEYHLEKWADHTGHDKQRVDATFKSSQPLRIIHDLWNNDKHGYPPRQGSKSGLWPRLGEIRSFLRLATQAKEGSSVGLTFTLQGVPRVLGDGTARVIISGDILDRDGDNVGDLYETALQAVEAWESLVDDFGVKFAPK